MDATNNLNERQVDRKFDVTHSEDFILQIDNFLAEETCQSYIDMFHFMKGHGLVINRQKSEGVNKSFKSDDSTGLFFTPEQVDAFNLNSDTNTMVTATLEEMWSAYDVYEQNFMVNPVNAQLTNPAIKIQKTEPTEGYHVWHAEKDANAGSKTINRHLAWAIYLNDIEDGGETEFIHQKLRTKPKAGRLVMWPAGFTHIHRGNPPLKSTKYILTGWISF